MSRLNVINKRNKIYLIPILFAISVIPLIVFLKVVPLDEITYQFWLGTKTNNDFFSYYKSLLIIASGIAAFLSMLTARYYNEMKIKHLKQYYIPFSIYALLVILSAVTSKYPVTAVKGFADRYEGVYVLLSYIVLAFAAINLINNEKHLKLITAFLFASAAIVGLIGIGQFFGLDIFKTQFGKELILPPQYKEAAKTLEFTFGEHTIYSTLYNTNYVGSYMAMLFPLSIIPYLYSKKTYMKVITGLFSCLMFANMFGCRSRTGYIGSFIAVVILAILFRIKIKENLKQVLVLLGCIIIIANILNTSANGELFGRVVQTLPDMQIKNSEKEERVKDIQLSNKNLKIVTEKVTITVVLSGNDMMFYDQSGKDLILNYSADGTIIFKDPAYKLFTFRYYQNDQIVTANIGSKSISFFVYKDGFKIIGERGILVDQVDHPESFGFEGKEKFFSMRGYIWSRSIPLLKNTMLIGTGPDTFAMVFPQHDYIGKLNAFDKVNEIVDKPHDLYLQIAINTGIISLLALLALFVIYTVSSFKIYFRNTYNRYVEKFGVGVFAAIIGYLVAGIANDSLVSVAPVFWVLIGTGIACNYIISNKQATEEKSIVKSSNSDKYGKRGK